MFAAPPGMCPSVWGSRPSQSSDYVGVSVARQNYNTHILDLVRQDYNTHALHTHARKLSFFEHYARRLSAAVVRG